MTPVTRSKKLGLKTRFRHQQPQGECWNVRSNRPLSSSNAQSQRVQLDESFNTQAKNHESLAKEKNAANKNRYKLRKEFQSKRNRCSKVVGELEAKLEILQTERQAILDLFISDSTAYARERNERLDELTTLIETQEVMWLEKQEELDEIDQQLEELT